jgi:hypothetical protein
MIVPETRFVVGNLWAVAQSVPHRFSGWLNQLKMLMITVSRIVFNPLLYRLSYRAKEQDCSAEKCRFSARCERGTAARSE